MMNRNAVRKQKIHRKIIGKHLGRTDLKTLKVVRIYLRDSDATDSSSDEDEEDGIASSTALFLTEIRVEGTADAENDDIGGASLGLNNCPSKFRGVCWKNWGRYAAEIVDPVTKKRNWLGSFETAEEAAIVYDKAAIQFYGPAAQTNLLKPPLIPAMMDPNFDELRVKRKRRRRSANKFQGVRRRNSGKYAAEIRDPATKKRIWLGTFNTEDEAAIVYDIASLRLHGTKAVTNLIKPSKMSFSDGNLHSSPTCVLDENYEIRLMKKSTAVMENESPPLDCFFDDLSPLLPMVYEDMYMLDTLFEDDFLIDFDEGFLSDNVSLGKICD